MDWRNQANCATADPEIFFSISTSDIRAAKKVCNNCYVQSECLEEAITSSALGIWAGMDEYERARVMKRRIDRKVALFNYEGYYSNLAHLGVIKR